MIGEGSCIAKSPIWKRLTLAPRRLVARAD
jgi:hypothetical protein